MRHLGSTGDDWDMAGSSHGAGQAAPLGEKGKLLLLPSISNGTRILQGGWWGQCGATERPFLLLPLLLSTPHEPVPVCTFS